MVKLKTTRLVGLLLVPLLLLGGCTRRQMQESGTPEDEAVTVLVQNENVSLVRMYVSAGSIQQWMGNVSAGQGQRFTVPGVLLHPGATQLMFSAEALQTGERYNTPLIVVKPGNLLRIELGSRLNFSTWNLQ
jgi:hypothetical protein